MTTTVKLSIRNPCLDEAREIDAPLDWTVLQVKQDVEKNWPEHPSPTDQRLIYSGKLLDEGSKLEDVLRLEEGWTSHTIHLVCRQLSAMATARASKEKSGNIRKRNTTTAESSVVPENSAYWQACMQAAAQGHHQPSSDQHQIMMQQMYAHYLQQYMQYVSTSWDQGAGQPDHQMPQQLPVAAAAAAAAAMMGQPHHDVQQAPVVVPEHPVPEAPGPAGPGGPGGPGGDGNLGNAVMNAGAGAMGAMEDDDEFEGGQRDLLDWFYVASRVVVLFSIIYFYSSFARFALVMGLGLILYLYRIGIFGNPNFNQEAPAPAPAPSLGDDDNAANTDHGTTDGSSVPEEPIVPEQPWYAVASTFVTTFFTSLMPNDPQVV